MIDRHLLIAVRDILSTNQGVRFVGDFFHNHSTYVLTLLCIQDKKTDQGSSSAPWSSFGQLSIEKVLETCSNSLGRKGFPPDRIQIKKQLRKFGTVKDIVLEGRSGLYDAVVLGKRSSSFLGDLFVGNVTGDLLDEGPEFPIWFCKDPKEQRRNVLVCLDGSETGLRITDHVGYILSNEMKHNVTLLHIQKQTAAIDLSIFDGAKDILSEHGITENRIHTHSMVSSNIVSSVNLIAEQNKFAAVAVGRTDETKHTGLTQYFTGETCRDLLEEIEHAALWVVP